MKYLLHCRPKPCMSWLCLHINYVYTLTLRSPVIHVLCQRMARLFRWTDTCQSRVYFIISGVECCIDFAVMHNLQHSVFPLHMYLANCCIVAVQYDHNYYWHANASCFQTGLTAAGTTLWFEDAVHQGMTFGIPWVFKSFSRLKSALKKFAIGCKLHHLSSSCSRSTLVVCVTDVVNVLMDARTVVTIVESSTAGSALIHMISPSVPCTHCGEPGHYNVWVTAWHISTIRLYTQTVSHYRVHPEHPERLYHSKKYGFHLHRRPSGHSTLLKLRQELARTHYMEQMRRKKQSRLCPAATWARPAQETVVPDIQLLVSDDPVTFDCVCPVLQCLVFAYFELTVFAVSSVLNCILVVLIICFVATPY